MPFLHRPFRKCLQTKLPCVEDGAIVPGDVAVEIRDGVGWRSGHVGPSGQCPSR